MECLGLRIKDVDFANRQIIVRDGKACPEPVEGAKATVLFPFPKALPLPSKNTFKTSSAFTKLT